MTRRDQESVRSHNLKAESTLKTPYGGHTAYTNQMINAKLRPHRKPNLEEPNWQVRKNPEALDEPKDDNQMYCFLLLDTSIRIQVQEMQEFQGLSKGNW